MWQHALEIKASRISTQPTVDIWLHTKTVFIDLMPWLSRDQRLSCNMQHVRDNFLNEKKKRKRKKNRRTKKQSNCEYVSKVLEFIYN